MRRGEGPLLYWEERPLEAPLLAPVRRSAWNATAIPAVTANHARRRRRRRAVPTLLLHAVVLCKGGALHEGEAYTREKRYTKEKRYRRALHEGGTDERRRRTTVDWHKSAPPLSGEIALLRQGRPTLEVLP